MMELMMCHAMYRKSREMYSHAIINEVSLLLCMAMNAWLDMLVGRNRVARRLSCCRKWYLRVPDWAIIPHGKSRCCWR